MIYQQLGEPYRQPGGTMHFLKNVGSLFGFGGKNIVVDSGIGFHLVNGISKTYTADIDQLDGVLADFDKAVLDEYRKRHPHLSFVPLEKRETFYIREQYPQEYQPLIEEIYLAGNTVPFSHK